MISSQPSAIFCNESIEPTNDLRPRWYAAYTFARHEKCVALQLQQRGFDHFLPIHQEVHRWKDRRKVVEMPLFPGYVFVRMCVSEQVRVLQVASVAQLVSVQGKPVALPDAEIDVLRNGLSENLHAEPHPYLRVGRRVHITRGPLAGASGVLVRKKQGFRVVLSVEMIMRSVSVEIDIQDVAPAS